ncbi:MAG: PadR family transcriptional regulator [Actinomycetota bacterium]
MPIHHAVLAILAAGPSHGYELKATFEEAIGPQWGELNIGHLYQVLERLVRDGLVTRRPVPQRGRPDRIDYRLTKAGRRELDEWLGEPFVPQGGYRDELFLKIFAAARDGSERLRRTIRAQRQAYLSELATLGELRGQHRDDPVVALLIEAAVLHTEANLRVLDAADERVDQLAGLTPVAQADQEDIPQAQ